MNKELESLNRCISLTQFEGEDYEFIKFALELLKEFEILKNYYEPFRQFLKDMFKKGYNEDLTKIKEWLTNAE